MAKLSKKNLISIGVALGVVVILAVIEFGYIRAGRVYIEKAEIDAPRVALSSTASGSLREVYVQEGDLVNADTVVARVGNELIKTKTDALVVDVREDIGKMFAPGEPVITIINPSELRIVGHLEENKGLNKIQVGDSVRFTVDAFGGKKFTGIVDKIAPASRDNDLMFSISDKREAKVFDIFVRFDMTTASELKDGMSAKVWVNTK